jgi:hypothetical protein
MTNKEMKKKKMYIAVLDQVPDFMTPTLVAHSVLGAHAYFTKLNDFTTMLDHGTYKYPDYIYWLHNSFKKVTVRVNQKEFDKIAALPDVYLGHENTTLDGAKSCAIVLPMSDEDRPNVIKYAKAWKPKYDGEALEKELALWKEHFDDGNTIFDGEDLICIDSTTTRLLI